MKSNDWQVVTPEQAGIPSGAVIELIDHLEMKGIPMHGLVVLRGGKVAFEAYWKPFDGEYMHRMYSSSKSFVAVAIGILAGEGRMSLDDRVIDFFPEYLDAGVHPYTQMTTVRDLLSMRTPFTTGDYANYSDWTEAFFRMEASHYPGMVFRYDTIASVMLGIIVKRVTGEEFLAYLRPRLFEPAGMSPDIWAIQTPCGHDWAGSGVMCTTRDLARFAQVVMQGGVYEGRQLIPSEFARAATSKISDNVVASPWPERSFGYGYQFWLARHGFVLSGMGSQVAVCVPEADLVVATTADSQSLVSANSDIYQAVWDMLPKLSNAPLPEDGASQAALERRISGLSLKVAEGAKTSPIAADIAGRRYTLTDNTMKLSWLELSFEGDEGALNYENATGAHTLKFGFGHQVKQEFPETHYHGKQIWSPLGRGYNCHVSAAWVDASTLQIWCYATDWHMGTFMMNIAFKDNLLTVQASKYAEFFFDEYQGFASGTA